MARAARALAPTLFALTFAGVAHAQGTIDFSGAQTLMGSIKTFCVYAGAIVCFCGLVFAGIRMMSGNITQAIMGLGGAIVGAGVLGWGAGWISFDHGYAVTSHGSQGLTADRVLVNIDSNVHPGLINDRFAYVSVSRAAYDAQLFTDSAAALAPNLSHAVTKSSALSTAETIAAGFGM